jgi:hypothetical protein
MPDATGDVSGWIFRGLLGGLMTMIGLYARQRTQAMRDQHEEIKEDLSKQGTRLDKRIDELDQATVKRGEYEAHIKHQDDRYEAMMRMIDQTVKLNSAEHARICGKMDAIPQMVKDEVAAGIESLRREIHAMLDK